MENWRDDPATDRQYEYAKNLGVNIPAGATKGEASDIIDEAKSNGHTASKKGNVFRGIKNKTTTSLKILLSKVLTLIEIVIVGTGVYCFITGRNGLGITCIVGLGSLLYLHRVWLPKKGLVMKRYKYKPVPELIHGVKGTFDESYFVNPKTGNFQFPKYKHDKKYLVKIIDETEYSEFWDGFSAEEKREYSIYDFENDISYCIEINDVESLDTLFYKSSTPYLQPLTYLKGNWSLVQNIMLQKDDEWLTIDINNETMTKLLKDGYLFERVVSSDADKLEYFQTFNLPILKDACKEVGLNVANMNKRKIVDEMIAFNKSFNLPTAVVRSPKFDEWYNGLVQVYINDIKENSKRFHPLYHKEIWEAVKDSNDDAIVCKIVDDILELKYWEKYLKK